MADMVMAVIGESFGGGAVAEMRRELADVEKRQEAILDAVEAGMAARGLVFLVIGTNKTARSSR